MKSAVIVARNDNYGGHLAERATLCLNSLCHIFDEVVLVDWNSEDEPLINTILKDIDTNRRLTSVVVTPKVVKDILCKRQAAPVCEVLGRNLGIRIAKYDWICSTNIDIVIPEHFYESVFLKSTFYTSPRIDVPSKVWRNSGVGELINTLNRVSFPRKQEWLKDDFSLVEYCGDFQMAHRALWFDIKGFEETMLFRCYADSNVQLKAKLRGWRLDATWVVRPCHLDHTTINYYFKCLATPKNDAFKFLKLFKQTTNTDWWGKCRNSLKDIKITSL